MSTADLHPETETGLADQDELDASKAPKRSVFDQDASEEEYVGETEV